MYVVKDLPVQERNAELLNILLEEKSLLKQRSFLGEAAKAGNLSKGKMALSGERNSFISDVEAR